MEAKKESVKLDAKLVEQVRKKTKKTKHTIGGFFELGAQAIMSNPDQIQTWKIKAQRWDKLADKIAKFYPENHDENFEGDLFDIGEQAAIAFGYL